MLEVMIYSGDMQIVDFYWFVWEIDVKSCVQYCFFMMILIQKKVGIIVGMKFNLFDNF